MPSREGSDSVKLHPPTPCFLRQSGTAEGVRERVGCTRESAVRWTLVYLLPLWGVGGT